MGGDYMSNDYNYEPMIEMYLFETSQLIEQLEQYIISKERSNCLSSKEINEIFRIMHIIKGSSSMMLFNNISSLSYSVEDIFYYIREENLQAFNCSLLFDLVLES